mmetsp:Transcript_15179/g.35899  ORF Transcript_15179/g.35899 Transcript_15179/m.35899 type:complete len:266 (-) Transcript_15179:465-1262(-)
MVVMVDHGPCYMGGLMRHNCLHESITFPASCTTPLLVSAAPALLGFGPSKLPVVETCHAVIIALFNDMLCLNDGDLLHNSLWRKCHGHMDNSPRVMYRHCNWLVTVARRRRHGLRHVVLVQDWFVDNVGRARHRHFDLLARITHWNMHNVVDLPRWRSWNHNLDRNADVLHLSNGLVVVLVLNLCSAGFVELVAAIALVLMRPRLLPAPKACRAFIRMVLHVDLLRQHLRRRARDRNVHHVGNVHCPHPCVVLVVEDDLRLRAPL